MSKDLTDRISCINNLVETAAKIKHSYLEINFDSCGEIRIYKVCNFQDITIDYLYFGETNLLTYSFGDIRRAFAFFLSKPINMFELKEKIASYLLYKVESNSIKYFYKDSEIHSVRNSVFTDDNFTMQDTGGYTCTLEVVRSDGSSTRLFDLATHDIIENVKADKISLYTERENITMSEDSNKQAFINYCEKY